MLRFGVCVYFVMELGCDCKSDVEGGHYSSFYPAGFLCMFKVGMN